ncbi:MAG TPA: lipoyl synthase [Candidatus Thermoplasmatota archaeon]|nr:lipoyl synthase [Candidatus Thermoplasmatota archaeon]
MAATRLPVWLKVSPPSGPNYGRIKGLLREHDLHTVCEEARCPNVAECWSGGTATFMLLGDTCTRGCRFCAVKTAARPLPPDPAEPVKLAASIAALGLRYVVLTSVDRDDLADQGAEHFAACVRELKRRDPSLLVETLTPDFRGETGLVDVVLGAGVDVFANNLETVRRLTASVRDARAGYDQTLGVLAHAKQARPSVVTKSSLMLGLGETEDEVVEAMRDLRRVGCEVLTLGQYLRPSGWHLPVERYLPPEEFDRFREVGESLGFLYVASGPFVRSSYKAGEYFLSDVVRRRRGEA